MERNKELRTAWDFVEHTGRSIFLTGKAGTGKTTFLKTVVERSRKRCIVVAPTGVAAVNAKGVTIHSFFQLPFTPYVPGAKIDNKFDFSREKRKIIASIDLLIIDEISMVRADLLDAIDSVLRRFRDRFLPFGGVQLLMIGDLAQLTPVVTAEDEQLLNPYYDTPYFFGSKALAQIDYVTIQLDHVYRQQDSTFINLLNHIREGRPTAEDLQLLNSRCDKQPNATHEGYIRLTTHNQFADNYNASELKKLKAQEFSFKAVINGTFPDYSYPTAEELVLKKGAQVMFIKNDTSADKQYYNGRIGQVTYVDHNSIFVHCEGDENAIEVEPMEWENTRYTLNPQTREIEADVQGTFKQYPLRLAWAITIHKSQGLTFDHAIIDANFSFAPGQVYVALSRCRTLEGLLLAAPIYQRAIINDKRVDNYITRQEQEAQRSIEHLPTLKEEYFRMLLLQLFDFRSILQQQEYMVRLFSEYFYRSYAELSLEHKKALDGLKQKVTSVAEKWRMKIAGMTTEQLHDKEFLDRVARSADYFAVTLHSLLSKAIQASASVETNNKQAKQRLSNILPDLRQTWLAHRYLLTRIAEQGFSISYYLKEKQMSLLDAIDENSVGKRKQAKTKTPKPKKEKTWVTSYNLYRQGRGIDDIAKERNLTAATVFGHLARYVESGDIPLESLVSPGHQKAIAKIVRIVGDNDSITVVKSLCPPDVTFDEIRLFMKMNKK